MDESSSLIELIEQLRSKTAGNERHINILTQYATDFRVKRIIELLNEVAPAAEAICDSIQLILQLCESATAFHRGYHPHLLLLHQELTDSANHHSEFSKRSLLYFQHMENMGSSIPKDILHSIDSVIAEQQQLADHLRFEGYRLLSTAVSRPPGSSSTSFSNKKSIAGLQAGETRSLFDHKPLPIDHQYDARWDPDCKVPGSQYCKFLRFTGPFFFPEEEGDSTCDSFRLPESAGLIIDAWLSKYEAMNENFKETRRLPCRTNQSEIDALLSRQRSLGLTLAKTSGLPYDPNSINLFTRIHPRDVTCVTRPYQSSVHQVKISRLEMGTWEFEDLNRVLETQVTRSRDFITTMDGGRQVYFDRNLNRNVSEK